MLVCSSTLAVTGRSHSVVLVVGVSVGSNCVCSRGGTGCCHAVVVAAEASVSQTLLKRMALCKRDYESDADVLPIVPCVLC